MIDLEALKPWLKHERQAKDRIAEPLTSRLAALLDRAPQAWSEGCAIPSCWYVMLFGPVEPQSRLGPDGHPPKGDLLPPVPWPRRMFAGRRVEFAGELRIGDEITRRSRVTAITAKEGRTGPMCFVTLRHELHTPRGLAVIEEQDVVYRPAATKQAAETPALAPPGFDATTATCSQTLTPDNTLLFRYSAVTNNAHRIHYDQTYTRDVEGYPDLVVNGGLSTLLLWELAERFTERRILRSSTRNRRPLFVNRPLSLHVKAIDAQHATAWVLDADGQLAIEASLEFA